MQLQTSEKVAVAITSIVLWLGIGTVIFHYLENWNWIQSFYFSTTSMTTVGYGDLHPTTDLSRLIASFYILFGVGIVVTSLSVIGGEYLSKKKDLIRQQTERIQRRTKRKLRG